jgi:radical SAM superfamily enzyme with C-terminal helix-hairpin-helix motif
MKKSFVILMALIAMASFATAADFHIGVVTGTVSQSEDDLRGAEKLIEEYGSVADGGMIQHVTYPDNFMQEMETTRSRRS